MTAIPPEADKRERLPLALTVGLFACAFGVLAFPWLSGAVTIPYDAKAQFYPQQAFLARSLAEGASPFWTPYVFAGWPQVADPQSLIFSPPHLLLAAIDPQSSFRAVDAVSFAALFLGGLGLILFFRDRGWHPAGALVAALAFAFGGACAARLQHTGQIMSIAWFPLALWMLARALERNSWTAGAGAGLFAALMALGRDQVALLGLYVLAGFVIVHWVTGVGRAQRFRSSRKPLAAGALVGALIVIVPMVLTALLALESNRPEIPFSEAARGSLHPAHLLTFVFADLYGAADPLIPYWGPASYPWRSAGLILAQNMGQLYAGALVLITVVGIGLVRGALWAREIRFVSIAAGIVLLFALGSYTPLFRATYAILPGIDMFRRPADATFVLGALVAILSGFCVHWWLATAAPSTRPQRIAGAAIALAIFLSAVGVAVSMERVDEAGWPLLVGVAWLAGAILISVAVRRLSPLPAAVLLATFVTADLGWNNRPNESTGLPPSTYDALRSDTANATVRLLKERLAASAGPDRRDRIELAGIGYHWPNLSLVHGFDHDLGHNPLRLIDFARATGVGDTVAAPDQRRFAPLFPSYRSAMADLIGLRFIATGLPAEQIDRKLKPGDLNFIARTEDAYVYENPRALPRVMLMTQWRVTPFDSLFRDGWPEGVDPRTTVLLERQPSLASALPPQSGGAARLMRYANTEVVVAVESPSGGLLLLNDVWHPWWRASVDGAPVEILRANVLFRAVAVPPGRHEVRFTFRPVAGALDQIAARLGFSGSQR